MFFQDYFESEIRPHLSQQTAAKIVITGEATHKSLQEKVEESKLPKIYGGQCDCEATCIYSDKGPWTDIENKINFQNRYMTEIGGAHGGSVVVMEEFKLQEDDDDQVDLLGEKDNIEALQLIMMQEALKSGGIQSHSNGDGVESIRNNTIIGPSDDYDLQAFK